MIIVGITNPNTAPSTSIFKKTTSTMDTINTEIFWRIFKYAKQFIFRNPFSAPRTVFSIAIKGIQKAVIFSRYAISGLWKKFIAIVSDNV